MALLLALSFLGLASEAVAQTKSSATIAPKSGTVTEGDNAVFTVSARRPVPTSNLDVDVVIYDVGPGDFVPNGNEGRRRTVTIPANAGSVDYTVSTVDDTADEPNGAVRLQVYPKPREYSSGGSSSRGRVTVNDDDETTVAIPSRGSLTVYEGDEETFAVEISRGLVKGEKLEIPLVFPSDPLLATATRGTDYTLSCGSAAGVTCSNLNSGAATVTFTGPSASKVTITVTVLPDTELAEPNENAQIGFYLGTVKATGLGGGADGAGIVDIIIRNVRGALVFSPTSVKVSEKGTATYTVKLFSEPSGTVTVTVGGTSKTDVTVDTDSGRSGNQNTLTFTASTWNTAQTVTVTADDDTDTTDDTVTLTHSATGGGYNRVKGNVVVTVEELPVLTITSGAAVTEGQAITFTLTTSEAVNGILQVVISGQDAPSADFVNERFAIDGFLTRGQTKRNILAGNHFLFLGSDDNVDEPSGEVTLTLQDYNPINPIFTVPFTVGNPSSTKVLIRDNDPTIVSLARVGSAGSVAEGDTVEFTVGLGRPLIRAVIGGKAIDETIEVPLSIGGNSGVDTDDWSLALKTGQGLNTGVTLSGETTTTPSLRFSGAGAQTATLVLTVVDDNTAETGERIDVELGPDGTGANGFDRTGLDTNVDGGADPHPTRNSFSVDVTDDATPARTLTLTLTGDATAVTEGNDKTFTLSLSQGLVLGESQLVVLSISGRATRGTDYTLACPSSLPVGVSQCSQLNDGNFPSILLVGPITGQSVTSLALTLSATTDTIAESGGETVDIGFGTLPTPLGFDSVATTDNLPVFRINDASGGGGGGGGGNIGGGGGGSGTPPSTVDLAPTFGGASVDDQTWEEGREIREVVLPAASGGDGVLTYRVTPSLPAGVSVDVATRRLRGAPLLPQEARSYRWTARDADGDEAALTFSVTVSEDPKREGIREATRWSLAELGRKAMTAALDTISARFGAVVGNGLSVAGQVVPLEAGSAAAVVGAEGAVAWQPTGLSAEELLGGSAFSVKLAGPSGAVGSGDAPAEGGGPLWVVWGRGDLATFAGQGDGETEYDGWLRSGWLGLDARSGPWVAGLAVSREEGRADYRTVATTGRLETMLTGIYPYGRWRVSDGLEVHGVVGAGWGEARHRTEAGGAEETGDVSMRMASLGLQQVLAQGERLSLVLRADGAITGLETAHGPAAVGRIECR
ncbi:MAG: autotransporter outer membrane beta-barrel domain-containing protein [Synechococcus sp. SB0666_bin_14]|nr:autotransporter outer membrane beta-barrel domain-containing protein [Synechococcus sp. SB0666_bin_14]MYJ59512.1 autotransporter outer membrane beta-barrel domain-containing protein [Synechococcus sp. SB0672_bin_6]